MRFDMSELKDLMSDMIISDERVRDGVRASVKRGAWNVKREAQRDIIGQVGLRHAKHYPYSITFDILPGGMAAEIGPTIGRKQAFLGKILEYGTATSGAHPHMIPAVESEREKLAQGVVTAALQALASGS